MTSCSNQFFSGSDFNYTLSDDQCVALGPELIPAGFCLDLDSKYMGSSGWRQISGNTCVGRPKANKDKKTEKDCTQAQPAEGKIQHQTFKFPDFIEQHAYFPDSKMLLVRLYNFTIYQSSNEGYTWRLKLVKGKNYYTQGERKKLFDNVIGFAKFLKYLVLKLNRTSLGLQVSLDSVNFVPAVFPKDMALDTHPFTILESSMQSLFLFMTVSDIPPFRSILKSNSNRMYFINSLDNMNRNDVGYVDFEKMIGLDGIVLVNIVRDPSCTLHIYGYTKHLNPQAAFSTPSIVGVIMAVSNVGSSLTPYIDSNTFLSHDGGFTWREVHKGAHLWEFGDSGSIFIMANDKEPMDHILFTTDEGETWRAY
uniref:VPS10 domain-containing protein n=1 Tax=Moniliophthora roreri TaxID=221103 RepID=A0A0W0FFW9_MONRR